MSSIRSDATEAQRFARGAAAAVGVVFLLVGALGFIPGVTTDYDSMTFADHESGAELFGVFQVSVLHNIVHVLFGVGGTFVVGIGALLIGAVLMVVWSYAAEARPFFAGESLNRETPVLVPEEPETYQRSVDGGLM